jgi:hypothetical protein
MVSYLNCTQFTADFMHRQINPLNPHMLLSHPFSAESFHPIRGIASQLPGSIHSGFTSSQSP